MLALALLTGALLVLPKAPQGTFIRESGIVRQDGRVWAKSAPGQGATFFFTLPPADAPA